MSNKVAADYLLIILEQMISDCENNKHTNLSSVLNSSFNRQALQIAINELRKPNESVVCKDLNNKVKILQEELEKEKKNKIAEIQSNCDHHWGPVEWTWSCGGYRTCTKCGLTEDYYERD